MQGAYSQAFLLDSEEERHFQKAAPYLFATLLGDYFSWGMLS